MKTTLVLSTLLLCSATCSACPKEAAAALASACQHSQTAPTPQPQQVRPAPQDDPFVASEPLRWKQIDSEWVALMDGSTQIGVWQISTQTYRRRLGPGRYTEVTVSPAAPPVLLRYAARVAVRVVTAPIAALHVHKSGGKGGGGKGKSGGCGAGG